MKVHFLYPFDTGTVYNFSSKHVLKRVEKGVEFRAKVFRFGVGVIDVLMDVDSNALKDPKSVKFSQRVTLIEKCSSIAEDIISSLKKYATSTYPFIYKAHFIYPITIKEEVESDKITPRYAIVRNEEVFDVIELVLSQYWNLLSFDDMLNREIKETQVLLDKTRLLSFNLWKVIKTYKSLTKDAKDFYRDRLEIIDSVTNVMEEIPESYHPDLLDTYRTVRKVFEIDELINRVNLKLVQIGETYEFMRESIGNFLFIVIEMTFFFWFLWDVLTFLIKR